MSNVKSDFRAKPGLGGSGLVIRLKCPNMRVIRLSLVRPVKPGELIEVLRNANGTRGDMYVVYSVDGTSVRGRPFDDKDRRLVVKLAAFTPPYEPKPQVIPLALFSVKAQRVN